MSASLWDILNKLPRNLKCGELVLVSSAALRNKYNYECTKGRYEIGLLTSGGTTAINEDSGHSHSQRIYYKKVYRILFQSKILTIDHEDIHGKVSD